MSAALLALLFRLFLGHQRKTETSQAVGQEEGRHWANRAWIRPQGVNPL